MANIEEDVFPGSGEMAQLMRSHDWASTPLGPVDSWPESLRTLIHVMLTTRHPMFLWWGPELIQFYNDGYRTSLGNDRHPAALGAHGRPFWDEIWPIIGPQVEGVMQRGESTWQEDALVPILRNSRMEDVYWTYSYSPVLNEAREIAGTLVICQETTTRVLTDRRMNLVRVLAERMAAEGRSMAAAWQVAAEVIGEDREDFAFTLFYALDDDRRHLRLLQSSGSLPEHLTPGSIDVKGPASQDPWGLAGVLAGGRPSDRDDLRARVGLLQDGRWPEPIERAVALPVSPGGSERPYGVLLLGISPRLRLDEGFRNILTLLTSQIATAIVNIQAFEDIKQAADLKDQFLRLVSHELRTPISTVVGNASLLLKRADLINEEDKAQALEDIGSEGQKLQRVIENLLLLTRIEASNGPDFRRLTLRDLVSAAVDTYARHNPDRPVTFSADASAGAVNAEETLIQMVLDNLLGNADKYSPAGSPIEVRLRSLASGEVEVCVRDFGIGIAAADEAQLFTPFFRTASAKQFASGMGLGLSVCKRIIEAHGGRIWVVSRPDGGSDFGFSLPGIN
ncbi:MAG: ATP-binding protein [Dehalococcoidia bacterium]